LRVTYQFTADQNGDVMVSLQSAAEKPASQPASEPLATYFVQLTRMMDP
jgi:hypothetical protein